MTAWLLPGFILFFLIIIYLFIYLWLCWVFVSVRGPSPVVASGGHSSSWPLLLRSTGSRRAGSVIVAHVPSCSVACGILPDQGSNPCPLHWQADSQPLHHQGSPGCFQFWVIMNNLAINICMQVNMFSTQLDKYLGVLSARSCKFRSCKIVFQSGYTILNHQQWKFLCSESCQHLILFNF